MLLVCPHCEARYRVANERVPVQGARARCARCDRLFTVGLERPTSFRPAAQSQVKPKAAPQARDWDTGTQPDPFADAAPPPPEPPAAPPVTLSADEPLSQSLRLDDLSEPSAPSGIMLVADEAEQLAREMIQAVAAAYPERVQRARNDGRWDVHFGDLIRQVWTDFRDAAADGDASARDHFRRALNQVLAEGREVF